MPLKSPFEGIKFHQHFCHFLRQKGWQLFKNDLKAFTGFDEFKEELMENPKLFKASIQHYPVSKFSSNPIIYRNWFLGRRNLHKFNDVNLSNDIWSGDFKEIDKKLIEILAYFLYEQKIDTIYIADNPWVYEQHLYKIDFENKKINFIQTEYKKKDIVSRKLLFLTEFQGTDNQISEYLCRHDDSILSRDTNKQPFLVPVEIGNIYDLIFNKEYVIHSIDYYDTFDQKTNNHTQELKIDVTKLDGNDIILEWDQFHRKYII